MKKAILSTYWVVAVLLIAWVVQSLGYTFPEALFMAAFFLPGTFFALYIPRKVATEDDRRRGRSLFYALMGTWLLELCLLLAAHGTVVAMRHAAGGHADFFDQPSLLAHPMFIAMVVVTFVAGNSLFAEVAPPQMAGRGKRHIVHIGTAQGNAQADGHTLRGVERHANGGGCRRWPPLPQQDAHFAVGGPAGR